MRRSNQLSPMRSLVLLAVTWVAGTLLFAAEQTPRPAAPTSAATPANPVGERPDADAPDATSDVATTETADGDADVDTSIVGDGDGDGAGTAEVADAAGGNPTEAVDAPPDQASSSKQQAKNATAADTATSKGSPRRFVPSEQVRADFDVSFPIDI